MKVVIHCRSLLKNTNMAHKGMVPFVFFVFFKINIWDALSNVGGPLSKINIVNWERVKGLY